MGENKFWMALIEGTGGCSYRHPSLEEARKEAERLLGLPGNLYKTATILEAVESGKFVPTPVRWEEI